MKKWYVITAILALLLIISLSTCSINSALVGTLKDELSDVRGRLSNLSGDLVVAKQDLSYAEAELESKVVELAEMVVELAEMAVELALMEGEIEIDLALMQGEMEVELALMEAELALMEAVLVTEINFGNGLRVFDIEKGYYVRGKVQNVSTEPMGKAVVVIAFYNANGELDSVNTVSVYDLFPQETAEWKVWGSEELFDIYAIGNRKD